MYDVARENIGQNAGKYFPFIFSIFMFVLILNTFGLIPYVFTPTAHMAITFGLSVSIFIGVVILGFMRNGINYFSMFMPAGSPL
jgi:F0F1-type ATP synthase membrane subunit a